MQDVVAVATPRPRRRSAGRAGSCARGARRRSHGPTSANSVGQHLGSEPLERPVVAGGQHPPAGLALLAELLEEHAGPVGRADPQDAAARLRGLRRRLDVDATALRQVEQQPVPVVEFDDHELPAVPDMLDRAAEELVGTGGVRLQRGELQHVERARASAPPKDVVEAFGQRQDLRHLRHGLTLPPARAPRSRRSRCTRRSGRDASGG